MEKASQGCKVCKGAKLTYYLFKACKIIFLLYNFHSFQEGVLILGLGAEAIIVSPGKFGFLTICSLIISKFITQSICS